MEPNMKNLNTILAVGAVTAACGAAEAAIIVSYSQNFDSMGTSTQAITGSGAVGAQGVISGLDSKWSAARLGGTNTTGALSATVDNGASGSGGMFNYGATGSSDRSLGSLASGTTIAGFGLALENTSGYEATSITIVFDAKQFRSSTTAQNTLTFAYGFSSAGLTSTNFLSSTQMTSLSAGNVVGGQPVATNGPLNPPVTTAVSFTISGVSWGNGQMLFIRWQDSNEAGNDAGLAVDNFSLTAVPAPGAVALLGVAGLVGTRRRR